MDKKLLTGRTLGARMKEARLERGFKNRTKFWKLLTQTDPQEMGDTSYSSVFDWENDRKVPRWAAVKVWAKVTDYPIEALTEDPEGAAVPESGVLTDTQVGRLLDRLGASEAVKAYIMHELNAFPPKGGVTRDEVERWHRMTSKNISRLPLETPIDAEWDAKVAQMGGQELDQKDGRELLAKTKAQSKVDDALQAAREDAAKNG